MPKKHSGGWSLQPDGSGVFIAFAALPPTPSWGLILNEARAFMTSARHAAIAPGVAISLAVLGWNLLGDGLRDALDPRLTE